MHRIAACLLAFSTAALVAQTPAAHNATAHNAATVPVLMLSDIHFDPFHDPAKVPQLLDAPVSQWHRILSAPDSPQQAEQFADLQTTCKAKGIDTPMSLLTSALTAAHEREPHPLFITVSGDLMAHKFDCLYQKFHPAEVKDTYAADYSAFAAKTVAFVTLELHEAFPGVPVYLALGNNDSGCADYRESTDSAYLKSDAKTFSAVVLNKYNAQQILKDFSALGDYRVDLPAPFHHTRLLVMQDIFEAKRYATCGGKASGMEAAQQIAWLRGELADAREKHDRVWVMAHIPPGIDAYSTFVSTHKDSTGCRYGQPTEFLGSDLFADTLRDNTDVIKLVLLGHTHMDEMRLYRAASGDGAIPGKLVPSISPVDGNTPSFTVASVDPAKAILVDYSVYAAKNRLGLGGAWPLEYTYSASYNQPDYSAASVAALLHGFLADPQSKTTQSQAYESHYFVSGTGAGMNLKAVAMSVVWPVYACSITHDHAASFTACACPAN